MSQKSAVEPNAMEKRFERMEKQFTLIAKQFEPKPKTESNAKPKSNKDKSDKSKFKGNRWNDPEWRKSVVNETCNNIKNYNNCVRDNCPFSPCNKKVPGQSLYTTFSGFQ